MMAEREDLSYEKKETKTPYIFTGAKDIDGALERAYLAILDARSFREHAKATGTDVVKKGISAGMAAGFFIAGAAACLLALWCLGVL